MEWFGFQAGDTTFGINAQYVYRVVDDVKITPVPFAPDCHLGLVYHRGELFDVIATADLLGHGKADVTGDFRIILIKWSDKKLALVPDAIIGLLWIENNQENQNVHTTDDHVVKLITPDDIWNKLLELPYGPDQI